jgi:hypothetical protein
MRLEVWPVKSKSSSKARVPKDRDRSPRPKDAGDYPVILDFARYRIEDFIRRQGGGVSVSTEPTGYVLSREDNGTPVAGLRRNRETGWYDVLYRARDTGRWRSAGPFGGTFLPLDEALEFIASDPMDCFWTQT